MQSVPCRWCPLRLAFDPVANEILIIMDGTQKIALSIKCHIQRMLQENGCLVLLLTRTLIPVWVNNNMPKHVGHNLTIIGSDNGLPPSRHQAIIWTKAGPSLIRILGINFSAIVREIHTILLKMNLKMSSVKWRTFSLALDVFRLFSSW